MVSVEPGFFLDSKTHLYIYLSVFIIIMHSDGIQQESAVKSASIIIAHTNNSYMHE